MEILDDAPHGMVCRGCGTWVGKVYTDQAVLNDVIAMRVEKKPTLAESLGLQGDVVCRTCLRKERPDYDWLKNRGECSMCRMYRKRYRRRVREVKGEIGRKARKRS